MTPARGKLIPPFASDDEERDYWETHDIRDYDDGPATDVVWDLRPEKKKRVTIRLEPSMIAQLKEMAEELDMPYQTLTRGLIRRGLRELQAQHEARAASG